jgi:hypothetical protein
LGSICRDINSFNIFCWSKRESIARGYHIGSTIAISLDINMQHMG